MLSQESQRWPEPGEQACVVCGRFGEYECSTTGNVVCSRECKNAQLPQNAKKAQRGDHIPLGRLPFDYGAAADLQHGDGPLYAVGFDDTRGGSRFFTAGVGNLRTWELSPMRKVTAAADLVIKEGCHIRCCEVGTKVDGRDQRLTLHSLAAMDRK